MHRPGSGPTALWVPTGLWVLRHGESTANVEGIIVSAPGPRALTEVGLTERGRAQARDAGRRARDAGFGPSTVVVTSDFARARETAELFAAALGAEVPRVDVRLRERSFGTADGGPSSAYDEVWAADAARVTPPFDAEPVMSVAQRVSAVLQENHAALDERGMREEHSTALGERVTARDVHGSELDAPIVLVAHGDVLQIALALGAGMDPHDHRRVPHLGNAELRPVG